MKAIILTMEECDKLDNQVMERLIREAGGEVHFPEPGGGRASLGNWPCPVVGLLDDGRFVAIDPDNSNFEIIWPD
jgi:hypothetical protein